MSSNPTSSEAKEASKTARVSARRHSGSYGWLVVLCIFVSIACVVAALWVWYDTQSRIVSLRTEVAGQVIAAKNQSIQSGHLVSGLENQVSQMQSQIDRVALQNDEMKTQLTTFGEMYQDVVAREDKRLLGDIEHLLMVANQQLQLSSNVKSAIQTLEVADAMLSSADNAAYYLNLRKAIASDLEVLKLVNEVDLTGTALKLDLLIDKIDTLPFAAHSETVINASSDIPPETDTKDMPAWQVVLSEIWAQLKGLVTIRYLDKPDSALLSPEQSFFVKENTKLRLLSARVSLLMRDDATYHKDLNSVQAMLTHYFDVESKQGQFMVSSIKQLNDFQLSLELPTLEKSYQALRQFSNAQIKTALPILTNIKPATDQKPADNQEKPSTATIQQRAAESEKTDQTGVQKP